ncbi:MAG: hypothetical protein QOH21_2646 [Acidobacteriota bacterium]|nr:hypothetical protein [Acidobacteriota bacterium]
MPTVTVHFGGICTFFMPNRHPELEGFCRVVLVNAAKGRTVAGQDIPPHIAKVQIGDGEPVTVHGLHMRLITPSADSPLLTEFAEACPNLTALVGEQNFAFSTPSQEVVFGGDPAEAALYFDFNGGTLTPAQNEQDAVVTTLVLQSDEVTLETVAFGGVELPPSLAGRVFDVDTTIWVSNDDEIAVTSPYDFYLHYLTAGVVPDDPPIPRMETLHKRLDVIAYLPHWFGAIGAGCSNSTYP